MDILTIWYPHSKQKQLHTKHQQGHSATDVSLSILSILVRFADMNHPPYGELNESTHLFAAGCVGTPLHVISRLYTALDELLDVHGVYKVKTFGGEHHMLAIQTTSIYSESSLQVSHTILGS